MNIFSNRFRITLVLALTYSWLTEADKLFLTPYIEANLTAEAKLLSAVTGLPNAPDVESYSGFITVNKQYNSNLFFWFFPAFNQNRSAPVVVWLEGGPGQSSIWSVFSLNPVFDVVWNQSLDICKHSWAQRFSMLYIDNPVGTGFSFTDDDRGYSRNQSSVADNLYEFLQQFYAVFSEYRTNELYITGESYAGKYVPAIGHKLMQMSDQSNINFKGIAIGNALVDPINQINLSHLLKSMGYIDKKQMKIIQEAEEEVRQSIRTGAYTEAFHKNKRLLFGAFSLVKKMSNYNNLYDLSQGFNKGFETIEYLLFKEYIELRTTRTALHVGDQVYNRSSAVVYDRLIPDIMTSMQTNFTDLIADYKVMLFVGNFDLLVSVDSVNGVLENPSWKYSDEFDMAEKQVWKVKRTDAEMAGFVKSFDKFTFAVVRNAGHFVVYDKPREALDLITRFISDQLPSEANGNEISISELLHQLRLSMHINNVKSS